MKPLIPALLAALGLAALFAGKASAAENKPPTPKPPTPKPPVSPVLPTPPIWPSPPPTAAEKAAQAMVAELWRAERSAGSVKAAKGREDKSLVVAFQNAAKLTADGKAGPGTLLAAAAHGQTDLPHVFYWPTSATAQKVYAYRAALLSVAEKLATKDPNGSSQLKASAAREHGEAGIVGALAS